MPGLICGSSGSSNGCELLPASPIVSVAEPEQSSGAGLPRLLLPMLSPAPREGILAAHIISIGLVLRLYNTVASALTNTLTDDFTASSPTLYVPG